MKPTTRFAGKSSDTEENIDRYFTRPLGWWWAKLFLRFDLHPNVVTLLSILLGMVAAFFMAQGRGSYCYTMLGILCLFWANIYDSTDGQMARISGKKTLWGRILDGLAGNIWFVCIYAALALRLAEQAIFFLPSPVRWSWGIWLLLAFVGFRLHAPQSRLADYYRNVHLFFICGQEGSELDSSQKLRLTYEQVSWKKDWAWKLFLKNYIAYTRMQEQATPQFQKLKQQLDRHYRSNLPKALVKQFRQGSFPLLKWTNVLSFNWRALMLYASLLLAVENDNYLLLYPLAEILVFHSIYHYMKYQHERLSLRILKALQQDEEQLP